MIENPQRVWPVHKVLVWSQRHLDASGVDSARLDAELLLAVVLKTDRAHLITHPERTLSSEERQAYGALIQRRASREPVAYILGKREFYGRPFRVSPDVLIPRPETEHLVDSVLDWARREKPNARILDIGTGSGAIAISLACELEAATLVATDVSGPALQVAAANAHGMGVADRVRFVAGDLFAPVDGDRFDVIVSNPPYVDVMQAPSLEPEIREYEPAIALFAQDHGLAIIRRLIAELPAHLNTPSLFACEVGYDQADVVLPLVRAGAWTRVGTIADLQGHRRVVMAELR
ncbi:MAG: peptide chain release factor N(5)-glutamine methyltransferase [Deltaproteobacteria bacterium]|nr:peptide chain release factor N(5)-glutamine methyltransferase [Deltaproteobacteria bacterium]